MTTNLRYKVLSEQSYDEGFGAGFRVGFSTGYQLNESEPTSQPETEIKYFIEANKLQDRINKVMDNFELGFGDGVQDFLQNNPSVLPLVNETYSKIFELIPETTKVALEVFVDPESNQENIIAKIYSNLSFDDAIEKLDIFDKEWFAEQFIESEMLFNVSIDFE